MIADFKIKVYYSDKPRIAHVKVHNSVATLRSAVKRHNTKWDNSANTTIDYSELTAICHRFREAEDNIYVVVRFALEYIDINTVVHELFHAAILIWELEHDFKAVSITGENHEQLAWVMGELVQEAIDKLEKRHIYL